MFTRAKESGATMKLQVPPAPMTVSEPPASKPAKPATAEHGGGRLSEEATPKFITDMYVAWISPILVLSFLAFFMTVILKGMNNQWQGNFGTGFLGLYKYVEETDFFNYSVYAHIVSGFSWIFLTAFQLYSASKFNASTPERSQELRAYHRAAGRWLGIPLVTSMVILAYVASAARTIGAPVRVIFFSLGPASISGIMIFVNFVLGYRAARYHKDFRSHKGHMFYMLIWTLLPGLMRIPSALIQFMVPTCNVSGFSTSLGLFLSGIYIMFVAVYVAWRLGDLRVHYFKLNFVVACVGMASALVSVVLQYEGGGGLCFVKGYTGAGGTD